MTGRNWLRTCGLTSAVGALVLYSLAGMFTLVVVPSPGSLFDPVFMLAISVIGALCALGTEACVSLVRQRRAGIVLSLLVLPALLLTLSLIQLRSQPGVRIRWTTIAVPIGTVAATIAGYWAAKELLLRRTRLRW